MGENYRREKLKNWYEKNEGRISAGSLIFGFFFDSITLQSVDNLGDNIWLGFNLLIICSSIIGLRVVESRKVVDELKWARVHLILATILQFGFGAVLGAFFIFYFRSSALVSAWPFLLVLLFAMISNELFQKKYLKTILQISFLYFALFLFLIFLVPVIIKKLGILVFILSGLLSLALIYGFLEILKRVTHVEKLDRRIWGSIFGIFVFINFLYFTNLIPPIPLSLKDAGIYHSLERTSTDSYILGDEDYGWREYFQRKDKFDLSLGRTAYAWSSIYSPAKLNTRIVHKWQYKNPSTGKWETKSDVPLAVSGGRGDGFRTYSTSSSLTPGQWRVNVSTPRGQLIGRVSFEVVQTTKPKSKIVEIVK